MEISEKLYYRLKKLGMVDANEVRGHNVGASDYAQHLIQPWAIWQDYNLNPWDADIIKRVLRTKDCEPRQNDYKKIIHICQERLRQLATENIIKAKQEQISDNDIINNV